MARGTWHDAQANHNMLRQDFQQLRTVLSDAAQAPEVVQLRFRGAPGTTEGAPAAAEMANISCGPFGAEVHGYHITCKKRDNQEGWRNHRAFLGHPFFQELQYVVLFPCGRGGWYKFWEKVYVVGDDGEEVWEDGRRKVDWDNSTLHHYTNLQGMPITFTTFVRKKVCCRNSAVQQPSRHGSRAWQRTHACTCRVVRASRSRAASCAGVHRGALPQVGFGLLAVAA